MKYKIAFTGLGSIGRRHIQNVTTLLTSRGDEVDIHAYRQQGGMLDPQTSSLVSREYTFADGPVEEYDVVFVTNPTDMHFETIKRFAPATRSMFIEKPVFSSGVTDISLLELRTGGVYYVACPLRYSAVLRWIHKNIDLQSVYGVRAICSTYLPDWRPGTDYRESYSAHANRGGGVEIDLIHEWDYLTWFFGYPDKIVMSSGKYSELEIESNDFASYIGSYENRLIELHLDYFGRVRERTLSMYLPGEKIIADIDSGQIKFLKSGKFVNCAEKRNDYQSEEIAHFFDILDGRAENDNSIQNALRVLRLTKGELKWGKN